MVDGATQDWPAGTVFRLGSLGWLAENQVDLTMAKPLVDQWSPRGATLVGLAANQQLVGIMACQDQVKSHAQEVIRKLRDEGKQVYLVSGDSKPTVAALGRQLGFAPDDIYAEMRPEHKASIIRDLQQTGKRVAFVGDGINDAPALEQADLGIAVSRASDIARESADLVLLNSDVEAIPEALALAQQTLRTIKQNLFWAFFYNAAAIPLAALGFLSPILCAVAMGLSDLIVIGNSLSLRRWQYKR
jgi:Cu+-exporting ATPase